MEKDMEKEYITINRKTSTKGTGNAERNVEK